MFTVKLGAEYKQKTMTSAKEDLIFTKSEEKTLACKGYQIEKRVGEGSYAKVYLCKKEVNGKTLYLACKIIDTKAAPLDFVSKFLPRELQLLVQIRHPNIIHVEYIFQRRSKYYMFMRYAENGDLLEFVLDKPRLSENRSRFWTTQVLQGVYYLHEENIVHRDIKCENILITNNLNIKICDFGFARQMPAKDNALCKTFCGSVAYTAPEVLKGIPYDPKKSDVWAIGVVLFVMLNKKFPFNETTNKKIIEKQMARAFQHNPIVEETVSSDLKSTLRMMLEPDPSRRWSTLQIMQGKWISLDERHKMQPKVGVGKSENDIQRVLTQARENATAQVSAVTVLRPVDDTSSHSLFGHSYVDKSMEGKEMKDRILKKSKDIAAQRRKQLATGNS